MSPRARRTLAAVFARWQGRNLTPGRRGLIARMDASVAAPARFRRLPPLTDPVRGGYRGLPGGLYSGGQNGIPSSLEARSRAAAAVAAANPRPRILLTIGMSNTTMESRAFIAAARRDRRVSPAVRIVDGAIGGMDCRHWGRHRDWCWAELGRRLRRARVNRGQVRAAWIKHGLAIAPAYGGLAEHLRVEVADTLATIGRLAALFPNLGLVFISSRIYAGWAKTPLSPEPWAYESAFAVRRAIAEWNRSHTRPVALWGPYLWADGSRPRRDGLRWLKRDFTGDGVHPSRSGCRKVAALLLRFFLSSPASAPWFRRTG